ncbi:MAG TPA: tyrosine--tRNA ligase, partial [Candidatus Angelobacter sp.]|nr:tyrosine--tRNA ligase [Candidatus Angelobacter sp.]
DQKFNLHMGRTLQKDFGQLPQIILTMPILEGTDGVQKMSKSYGNYIGISEPPQEIYGKVMSVSDELMWRYYELLTDHSSDQIAYFRANQHPMDAKKNLAAEIVTHFHGAQAAISAADDWMRQFQLKQAPVELERSGVCISAIAVQDGAGGPKKTEDGNGFVIRLDKLLAKAAFGSVSECMRKIREGAVEMDGAVTREQFVSISSKLPVVVVLRLGRKVREAEISQ